MNKFLLFVLCAIVFVNASEVIVDMGETQTITGQVFENYSGDFVIKNNGTLILENCTFRNNKLGSKNEEAVFSDEKIIAPIVNFGKLSVKNCKFTDNYSWNTALNDNFEVKAAAGAVVNFGELEISDDSEFVNNRYQKGYFTVLRNNSISQFDYLGNDNIFNAGSVEFTQSAPQNQPDSQIEVILLENPVLDKALFMVNTNKPVTVKITVWDAVNIVYSSQKHIENSQIVEWNLNNNAGAKVAAGAYSVKIEADGFAKVIQLGVKK